MSVKKKLSLLALLFVVCVGLGAGVATVVVDRSGPRPIFACETATFPQANGSKLAGLGCIHVDVESGRRNATQLAILRSGTELLSGSVTATNDESFVSVADDGVNSVRLNGPMVWNDTPPLSVVQIANVASGEAAIYEPDCDDHVDEAFICYFELDGWPRLVFILRDADDEYMISYRVDGVGTFFARASSNPIFHDVVDSKLDASFVLS